MVFLEYYIMEKLYTGARGKAEGSVIQVVMDSVEDMRLPLGPEITN